MRARYPDSEGFVERDAVRTHYEVHGTGDVTLLLLPPSPITKSLAWKAQIHYLSRYFRVVTFDGRGCGRSDRPADAVSYQPGEFVADAEAILDHIDAGRSILVTHCHSAMWALLMLSARPERYDGWVAISPGLPHLGKANQNYLDIASTWETEPVSPTEWSMCNPSFWRNGGYHRWNEFFFSRILPESHTTKQRSDAVAWADEVPAEIMIAAEEAPIDLSQGQVTEMLTLLRAVQVLVMHGSEDACQMVERGRAVADLTDAEYLELEGVGHIPPAREPVLVNLAIKDFVERVKGAA